ncbi:hypothetical protein SAMN05216215_10865 [Saccharopolyspora shandongensis]|uniref:Uncharacterized protein n=1 Tax=Saccharopolyspora shandongensis TaxID=418495 RepID=A0A1H3TK26_9PSEU|nr:hypothetical protein [Saccharopolyspora shandongensis]SDZ50672.1 hypothetical protein SAMN05216215_10865 [Saccharopolyspora shandongensis]
MGQHMTPAKGGEEDHDGTYCKHCLLTGIVSEFCRRRDNWLTIYTGSDPGADLEVPTRLGESLSADDLQRIVRFSAAETRRHVESLLPICQDCCRSLVIHLDGQRLGPWRDLAVNLMPAKDVLTKWLLWLTDRYQGSDRRSEVITATTLLTLQRWRVLAESPGTQPAHIAARNAWIAAQQARAALLSENHQLTIEKRFDAAKSFAHDWLGWSSPTDAQVQGVVDALLCDAWISLEAEAADDEVVGVLKRLADKQHLDWRPLHLGKIRGQRITSLSAEFGHDRQRTSILETLPGPDLQVGWSNPRVDCILNKLKPVERNVVLIYADSPGMSWKEAAEACGQPAKFGEQRVRRQVSRLVKQHRERQQARRGAIEE